MCPSTAELGRQYAGILARLRTQHHGASRLPASLIHFLDRPLSTERVSGSRSIEQTELPEQVGFFAVRWLERLQLGTSYPVVTERVARVVGDLARTFPEAQLRLVVDQTGVGLPVVEMVREALRGSRCSVTGAVLTGSERMEGSVGRREIRLGKTHLVSRLQVLLEQRLIALPETSEGRRLAQELQDFEIRVNENANLISGAFRTGAHDDLVVALGLSCLDDPRKQRVGVSSLPLWD